MRIIGLLSWFDEEPEHLVRAVTSYADAGLMDGLVAVDGRYALYDPTGPCVSEHTQHAAITAACETRGVDLALVRRESPWTGEIHKRGALFRYGLAMAEVGTDWFWVIDADNELIDWPDDFRGRLEETPEHVCEVTLAEEDGPESDTVRPLRQLFRAHPGMAPYGRHSYYVAKINWRWQWLWDPAWRAVPAMKAHEVVVRHHHACRSDERQAQALAYYLERDKDDPEVEPSPLVSEGPDGYPVRVDNEASL